MELSERDLILAEGLTVMSCLDTGDRVEFHNLSETIGCCARALDRLGVRCSWTSGAGDRR
jgi:hypothetical protein